MVQPNALDPQFEAGVTPTPALEPGVILAVSRLVTADSYKGVDHLIAAIPAIRAAVSGARLRVIGDGNDRPRLEALAAEQPPGGVEFMGRVSDRALREHLASCQLFALPSRSEGFGLVYLEAMANGKPCIAADDAVRKLEYDLYYIRHFSFLLDATIVLKTIHIMLFGKGR